MISKKKVRLLCLLAAAAVLFCFTACKHKTEELPQLEQAPEHIEVPEDTVEDMPQIQAVDPRGVGLAGYTMDNGPLCERRADDPSPTVIQGSEALPESFGRWWRVCVWDSAAQGYTVHYYDRSEGDTMLQLASTALSHLYGDDSGISVASAAVHKSFAIIDVALEENSAEAAALADEDAVRTLLNSVYTTFVSNNFYQCGFTLNGGKFALGGISLQDDGYGHYEDAPALYSLPAAPGAYSAIRAQFPYPYGNGIPRVEAPYEKNDINHIREYSQIYSLLYYARDVGEYASPEAIDAEKIIAGGLSLAPDTYDCAMQPENFPLYPLNEFLLDPLAAAVNDFQFTPEEWVAAAAKQLWGPNLTVHTQALATNTSTMRQRASTPRPTAAADSA